MFARPISVDEADGGAGEPAWIAVCDLDRLKAEGIVRVGKRDVLLIWNDGDIVASERACPHEQADLGLGHVVAGRLFCPRHAASFDLRDGTICPGWPSAPLRLYPVRVTGGQVWLSNPAVGGPRRPGCRPGGEALPGS